MNTSKKIIALLLLIIVLFLPAISKLSSDIPPEWFLKKFDDTILNAIPSGLTISFLIILALEIIAPVLMIVAIIKILTKRNYKKILSSGFLCYYTLFLILTFGSFLVKDYDNGFKDFTYFIGILLIENLISRENQSSN